MHAASTSPFRRIFGISSTLYLVVRSFFFAGGCLQHLDDFHSWQTADLVKFSNRSLLEPFRGKTAAVSSS